MSVRVRKLRPFEGTPTTGLARLLVLPRAAFREVFRTKAVAGLYTAGFFAPVGACVLVWLKHNVAALARTPLAAGLPFPIDERFFGGLLLVQAYLAFGLTLVVGPSLVSPDLVNGALPLYLSRPLTRWQYVTGKLLTLVVLLSSLTWAPLLVVYLLQACLAPGAWLGPNLRLGVAIVLASLLLVVLLSLVAMALSAWVKNRALARAVFLALTFVPAALGEALNKLLDTDWGGLLNLGAAYGRVLEGLFGIPFRTGLPLAGAWGSLLAVSALALLLLHRKLRAFEVVR